MKTIVLLTLPEVRAALAAVPAPVLLEALPPRFFAAGHLPGARRIPHDATLADAARGLVPDPATPVIVYCAGPTCDNSRLAAERLVALGYRAVAVFEGGKAEWTAAGLALESEGKGAAA